MKIIGSAGVDMLSHCYHTGGEDEATPQGVDTKTPPGENMNSLK